MDNGIIPAEVTLHFTTTARKLGSVHSCRETFQPAGFLSETTKWIIQRYRLHEAVEKMTNGDIPDWSRLGLDLGYYGQAHFI